jgi:YD repeat-containing protein
MHMKLAAPLLLLSLALASRCADTPQQQIKQPERFISYPERMHEEERIQRKTAGLLALFAMTPDDSDSSKRLFVAIDSFNTEGHQTFNRTFGSDGQPIKEIRHRYEGNLLMETRQTEGERIIVVHYTYNADGRKTLELVTEANGDTLLTRQFAYDAIGNETEASFYRKANQTRLKKLTTYDAQGRPATVQERNGELVNWEERYTYGDTMDVTERSANGQVQVTFQIKYDDKGHSTSLVQLGADRQPRVVVQMTYDAQGRLLKEHTTGPKGEVVSIFEYAYDAKGTRTRRLMTRPELAGPMLLEYVAVYR